MYIKFLLFFVTIYVRLNTINWYNYPYMNIKSEITALSLSF